MTLMHFLRPLSAKRTEFNLLTLSLIFPFACSLDEVPFLMHDYDLRRTTNILEVMPNASDEQSNFFYWDFLSTLNAGKWFADSWVRHIPQVKKICIYSFLYSHMLLLEISTLCTV